MARQALALLALTCCAPAAADPRLASSTLQHLHLGSTANVTAVNEGMAALLADQAGLGTQRQFAQLTAVGCTHGGLVADQELYSALLLVVPGERAPVRRTASEPFLSLMDAAQERLAPLLPVGPINTAAAGIEAMLGRRLFPFRLGLLPAESSVWAVWEVSEGAVFLSPRVADSIAAFPTNISQSVATFAQQLQRRLSPPSTGSEEASIAYVAPVFMAAASGAAAVVAGSVPLWFCISCPVVLGMLAPFVWNLGLGQVAEVLCDHYALPDAECNDLWYAAFTLAGILSFASVVPIITLCRLKQCAKPGATLQSA